MCWYSLLIGLAPLGAGNGPLSEDVAKLELQRFQGSWKAVAIHHADGRPATKEELQNTRLVVEGTTFTLTIKDVTISGTFTISPTKRPKTIGVLLRSKDGRETKFLGIYQIQGETRKSCFALPEKARPTQFSS